MSDPYSSSPFHPSSISPPSSVGSPLGSSGGFPAGSSSAPSPSPASSQPRLERSSLSVMLFVLVFLVGIMMIPWLAEQIVYSMKRGEERAKAEVAKQLLDETKVEQRIPWVAKVVAPSVVGIRTITPMGRGGVGLDVGSGVIVDPSGYILTNNHVIANAKRIMIRLNDGRPFEEVELVGRDEETDLAVLKIKATELRAIAWGDSTKMEVGDGVVAIGNPYDLGQTVTSGIISATERYNPLPGSGPRVQEFLQTDTAINPGNSGGPLVNMNGELIGINTAIYSQTGGNLGIGFAIPSILVKRVYDEIRESGEVKHGWLGIFMEPLNPEYAEKNKLDAAKGVVIKRFFPQSPAEKSGLKIGDIIVRWNDKEITDPLSLAHVIILSKPGTQAEVEIIRNSQKMKLQVTLGSKIVDL